MEDNASANDWGVNKMCYGRCANVEVRKTREIESLEGLWLKYRYLLFFFEIWRVIE